MPQSWIFGGFDCRLDKTRHLKTSPWALETGEGHLSRFCSEFTDQTINWENNKYNEIMNIERHEKVYPFFSKHNIVTKNFYFNSISPQDLFPEWIRHCKHLMLHDTVCFWWLFHEGRICAGVQQSAPTPESWSSFSVKRGGSLLNYITNWGNNYTLHGVHLF